ncbi:hypothetical protein ACFPRL_06750 [Pseudoclavibacter helvolus]
MGWTHLGGCPARHAVSTEGDGLADVMSPVPTILPGQLTLGKGMGVGSSCVARSHCCSEAQVISPVSGLRLA